MRIQEAIDLNSWLWRLYWGMYSGNSIGGIWENYWCCCPDAVKEAVNDMDYAFDKAEVVLK